MHSHISLYISTQSTVTFLGDHASKLFLVEKERVGLGAWFVSEASHRLPVHSE